uniref:Uncharacterized protein n=1 Tax=Lepeophtheirus salmonis TaxID=72036 RepID=A0A0K2TXH4_LEPSM
MVSRDLSAAGSSGYEESYCPEGVPIETAVFAILGAFAVAFGILFRTVTQITGRRRSFHDNFSLLNTLSDTVWSGRCLS